MSDDVNRMRSYSSPAREEQARATRRRITAAAGELFLAEGFGATSVPAVARAAGVSVQSVYKGFGSKARLAKAVFDLAIAGDDEDVPVLERGRLQAVATEPDPRRKLERYGDFLASVSPRHVPLQLVIRDAATTDADAAAVWAELQAERLTGMGRFADALGRDGHLRRGVTRAVARDVLWTYNSAELFQLLVMERGWSPQRYGRFVASALTAALLPPS
jgi:AcrR family transcriptional regulator